MPDILIFNEQSHPCLQALDRKYPLLVKRKILPKKLIVLVNSTETRKLWSHIQPVFISKPVLLSEFLKRADENRVTDSKLKLQGRRETDTHKSTKSNITGARLLVVDDNKINQEVAIGILKTLELEFEQASNGQEAIDRLVQAEKTEKPFHCILMDCQMPIVNGYDASYMIRNGEAGESNKNVPIIAMTASAMMGEREKCLNAGMNDYITKPVSSDTLKNKVIQWLSPACRIPADMVLPETKLTPLKSNDVGTNIHWNKKAALTRLMNNEDLLKKICELFLDSSPKKLDKLKQAVRAKDLETIRILSHGLIGTSGDTGATKIHDLATTMETLANNGNIDDIESCMNDIEKSYEALKNILQAEFLSMHKLDNSHE